MSSSRNNMRAGIVDNALIVSFPAADAPRVWRTDMGQFLTAALEIQDHQGKFSLVMKRSGAPVEEIVTFTGKKDAVDALQLITDALLQGKEIPQAKKSGGWFKKLMKFILTIVVLLFALATLANIVSKHRTIQMDHAGTPPALQTGVPAPADDIIGK
jgi:hypothetical protein